MNKLEQLIKFIENYNEFNQHSLDNDIIGIGNRLNLDTNELSPYEEVTEDYFGEKKFAEKYNIPFRDAVYLCEGEFSKLNIKINNPDKDKDGLAIISKKSAINVLRKYIKNKTI